MIGTTNEAKSPTQQVIPLRSNDHVVAAAQVILEIKGNQFQIILRRTHFREAKVIDAQVCLQQIPAETFAAPAMRIQRSLRPPRKQWHPAPRDPPIAANDRNDHGHIVAHHHVITSAGVNRVISDEEVVEVRSMMFSPNSGMRPGLPSRASSTNACRTLRCASSITLRKSKASSSRSRRKL